MIVYGAGTLKVSRLSFATVKEFESFGRKIEAAVRAIHPGVEFDDDVEFEWDEYGGRPEKMEVLTKHR